MTIADVMRQTGLTRKAIYLYEERGLLTPGKISAGSFVYREYSEEDLRRLVTIARLRELEVPLSEISQALESGRIELVLHEQLMRQQVRLTEQQATIDRLNAILDRLPPNSGISEFEQAADDVLPRMIQDQLSCKLVEDYPKGYVRRLAVLLYEAFLDKPLDSQEGWNAWYSLLDTLEHAVTPALLDAYTDFYGGLTTEQLCEDYRLRRCLVCGYTQYGPPEMDAKARELMREFQRLLSEPRLREHWLSYYDRMVKNTPTAMGEVMETVRHLSLVYSQYEAHFLEMRQFYLFPFMERQEKNELCKALNTVMGGEDILNPIALMYFDFYNNTLRTVLYPED